MLLCIVEELGNIGDTTAINHGILSAFGDVGDLVAQVFEGVVDGGGGKHQNSSARTGANDFFHQPHGAIHALASIFFDFFDGIASKVVGFIDNYQIIGTPIEVFKVLHAVTAFSLCLQVGVKEEGIVEAVFF